MLRQRARRVGGNKILVPEQDVLDAQSLSFPKTVGMLMKLPRAKGLIQHKIEEICILNGAPLADLVLCVFLAFHVPA